MVMMQQNEERMQLGAKTACPTRGYYIRSIATPNIEVTFIWLVEA